jgi:hypothetical protein
MSKSKHERPVAPFSDVHVEHEHVIATLLHDPTVEGLDMALYLDGSSSMSDEYEYKAKGAFMAWLTGKEIKRENLVEPQAQWMLEYLASKDRNGKLRVGYWACGSQGRRVEVVGELTGTEAKATKFPGPNEPGNATCLLPAIKDYTGYLREQTKLGARRGCAVFITDGHIHDADAVKNYAAEVAKNIARGQFPRTNFVLVGVGPDVNEEQMEEICHQEYPGVGHLWCHRIAEEITELAELVAVLVDETMTVAAGGTIYDDKGNALKVYEGRLPAVLEFDVPEGTESFTLEVNGQRFTQPIPEEHHDGGDDDDDDDDHH